MIELDHLEKKFQIGDQVVHALDDVSLKIEQGEYIAVMGPSGSGKSTLMNILGLLDRANSGDYMLDGINVSTLEEAERTTLRSQKIGFVFQSYHLVPRLSARENIELPMMLSGIPAQQRKQAVDDILDKLHLMDRAHHSPNQLSGGQRQRVAIGRAIVMKPSILLADEPTGNLDSTSGEGVTQLLESLNAEGITLMVVTHDATLGARAKRQLNMLDGRIV
ncbi:MAG: putative ABC transport system ATP-binding protein [Cycloclasticus pugetii]|jgi:putative ABC transport system ATP-binding protein|uniref:Peptide ABC transporter ATPase n=2 Tax=Cycloclasticus TaxID=34067 RepID=S5TCB0_9GAMM|nr:MULTISPECIES: ABC transporter ATP-binding protein [Cycloclasticus]AFT66150.1 ABC-type antimicrobial peptide transport system, ATPase component [Cycloclasticus sp. P1]AGS38452.1 Peptide ABC transporter ATPase [Cycloclasticus zancles 78-ME]ATI02079.1 ABC transporter ATP-binding protein [Cycloclasticus sp. PY97N]EPD13175.1 antimicrobial peptide ABC transporter ATPase [Cycloclasticus pugetii]MBV1898338.1 ABC transporter ATP-binding protein [Cycloclasticus sp.]